MGLSLGGSTGGTSSSSTANSNTSNTYSPAQTAVQNQTGANLSTDLAAAANGSLTPGTVAQETAADNQINQTSSGLTSRVIQFLAQRGFGQSGQTGQAALQGELGRESQIGSEAATADASENSLNSNNLLAALNYAFTSLGSSASGASSGNTSGWGIGGGVSLGSSASGARSAVVPGI